MPKPHHFPNPHLASATDLETSVHLGTASGDPSGGGTSDPTALSFTRTLMFYGHGSCTEENISACVLLQEARNMRKKVRAFFVGDGGLERSDIKIPLSNIPSINITNNLLSTLWLRSSPLFLSVLQPKRLQLLRFPL